MRWWARLGLRAKIFLPFSLLILATLLSVLWLINSVVSTQTETVRELRKKGHDVRFDVGGYGGYQAIKVEMHDGRRVYVGASESRKDGMAAGY